MIPEDFIREKQIKGSFHAFHFKADSKWQSAYLSLLSCSLDPVPSFFPLPSFGSDAIVSNCHSKQAAKGIVKSSNQTSPSE
jgi:hypothetical protein